MNYFKKLKRNAEERQNDEQRLLDAESDVRSLRAGLRREQDKSKKLQRHIDQWAPHVTGQHHMNRTVPFRIGCMFQGTVGSTHEINGESK